MIRCKFICLAAAGSLMLAGCGAQTEMAEGSGTSICYPADNNSMEDIIKQSSLAVWGTITAQSYLEILPVGSNEPCDFIDYSFEISEVFRGNSENNTITIRVPQAESSLKLNKKYFIFLYQPHMGGSYNTEGDYYYITACYDEKLQEDIAEYPVNEYYAYEHAVETAKNNVKNGVMTPEYLNEFMQEIQTYAQIIAIE